MKVKCAVFDLDGTLLNTLTDLTRAVNHAMEIMNKTRYSESEVMSMVGNGVEMLMKRALKCTDTDVVKTAVGLFSEYYGEHGQENTKPYDGICGMLSALKKDGIFVGVFSNKPDFAVKKLCAHYFADLVDYAMGTENGKAKKPDPFGVLKIMSMCGATTQNTVYIGDSEVDIETANNAQVPCISVGWGFKTRKFLQEHGAMCIADTPLAVAEAIARFGRYHFICG
ncbi:MAG: HAD family hydrolase [Corallococcus sp.]|nr:HAD family hydrolase [Corallococcus sp.]